MTLQKPPALKRGDKIAIVAPASPFEREAFDHGMAWLRGAGFEPVWHQSIFERFRYLAGSDAERARILQEALADDAIRGVFCARGGYGSARLIRHLDAAPLRDHCKVFVGFSDVTTLHLFLHRQCGWITFHGPMVATRWAREGYDVPTASSLLNVLSGSVEVVPPDDLTRCLRPGVARGRLLGGNLALLCHSLGTSYEPDLRGAILLLEDVHEAPYRIDRMLTQLRLAGKLDEVRGFVIGQMLECDAPKDSDYTVDDVVADFFADTEVPVVTGFPISHGAPNYTVALGLPYELDAERRTLTPMESATRP